MIKLKAELNVDSHIKDIASEHACSATKCKLSKANLHKYPVGSPPENITMSTLCSIVTFPVYLFLQGNTLMYDHEPHLMHYNEDKDYLVTFYE